MNIMAKTITTTTILIVALTLTFSFSIYLAKNAFEENLDTSKRFRDHELFGREEIEKLKSADGLLANKLANIAEKVDSIDRKMDLLLSKRQGPTM